MGQVFPGTFQELTISAVWHVDEAFRFYWTCFGEIRASRQQGADDRQIAQVHRLLGQLLLWRQPRCNYVQLIVMLRFRWKESTAVRP